MRMSSVLLALPLILFLSSTVRADAGWSAEHWLVNNWRRNDASAVISQARAPDGADAVAIDFKGNDCPNVVSPNLSALSKHWPGSFGSVGFYLRGDGSGRKITVQFQTENGTTFTAAVPLIDNGWKFITVDSLWTRDTSKHLEPNTIARIVISAPSGCSAAIGPMRFTPHVIPINLTAGPGGHAVHVKSPPTIDGKLDDAAWAGCPVMSADHMLRDASGTGNHASFRVAYDDANLYVAASIVWARGVHKSPPRMTRRDSQFWMDEAIEVFVNPVGDLKTDYQFLTNMVGAQGDYATRFEKEADRVVPDINWNGKWTSASAATDSGWSAEMAIPWKTMGVDQPPATLNFQFMYDDWRDAEKSDVYAAWSPSPLRPMDVWGVLRLLDESPAGRSPLSIGDVTLGRIAPGKLWLSARVDGVKSADAPIKLHVRLATPDHRIVQWDRELKPGASSRRFDGELDYDAPASGAHRLMLDASIVASGSTPAPAAWSAEFTQELPIQAKFGQLVLNPRPKKMELGKGAFTPRADDRIGLDADATARTQKTAEYLAKKLFGQFGILPPITRSGDARIHLRIDPGEVAKKISGNKTDQAYLLRVSDDRIDLIGADEPGLYYAVVTLNQLMRAAHEPKSPIPAVKIADWPSCLQRVYCEWVTTGWSKVMEKPDLQVLKNHIENAVAGSKYNIFVFTVDQSFVYKKHPKLTLYPMLTADEYRQISDFARDHFLEVVPGTMFGSHSNWITRFDPKLQEEGYGIQQVDVTKPGVYDLMADIYDEIIAAAGGPTKRFFIWHDEWWARPTTRPSLTHDGKTRQEIFLHDLMRNYDYLKSRGLRMMMWTDMLDPRHNGGPPFDLSEIAPKLPRDIIMCSWSNPPRWLHDLGFTTMQINNGFKVPAPGLGRYINGFGTIAYSLQHSLFSWVSDDYAVTYSWLATLRAGDYAWNMGHDGNLPLEEWARQYMPNLMATCGGEAANPPASDKITPIALPSDAKLAGKLNLSGDRAVGDIPMKLGATLVGPDGSTITLGKPMSCSSVILLYGVDFASAAAREAAHKASSGYPLNGLPAGSARLIYADGSTASMALRLGRNIIDMGGGVLNRYVEEGRDVFQLDNGQGLLQVEWVNPHPEREVKGVELRSAKPDMPILWAGLSLRGIRQ